MKNQWGWCYYKKLWTKDSGLKIYWGMFRRLDPPQPGELVQFNMRFLAHKPTAAVRHIVAEVNAGRATFNDFVNQEAN